MLPLLDNHTLIHIRPYLPAEILATNRTLMAPPRGSAAYKKKDGTLALSKDIQSVSWTPMAPPGSKAALTLSVSSITSES